MIYTILLVSFQYNLLFPIIFKNLKYKYVSVSCHSASHSFIHPSIFFSLIPNYIDIGTISIIKEGSDHHPLPLN